MNKMTRYILTGIQILIILAWAILGWKFGGDFNFQALNILPVPNLTDVILFAIMAGSVYGVQKVKVKLGIGEDFS